MTNMTNIENFLNEIKVYDCGLTKIRIGNKGDGGYVALREICAQAPIIYSFGVGDDIGFETDFAKMFPQAQFKLFDPTIEKLPFEHPRFEFFQWCIMNTGSLNIPDGSLLKIDVEWNEWDFFQKVNNEGLSKFNQILVEFHVAHIEPRDELTSYFRCFYQTIFKKLNGDLFGTYCKVMKKLNEQFYIFHIHANNSLPLIEVGSYSLPPLLEVSFVRKDLVDNVQKTTANFPVEGLDFPNKTDRQDILNWYPIQFQNTVEIS